MPVFDKDDRWSLELGLGGRPGCFDTEARMITFLLAVMGVVCVVMGAELAMDEVSAWVIIVFILTAAIALQTGYLLAIVIRALI
jgi:hypothetical protein